jgi:hypothetical protein
MLKKIPNIEPKNVPIEPIDVPINKNIFTIAFFDEPIVLSKAISPDLALTSMIMEDIILKAATKIIKVKIKNITFFSTFKALINVLFCFFQSTISNPPFKTFLIFQYDAFEDL